MTVTIFWFICGLVSLIAGAQLLVKGASDLAIMLGISPLVVGLTIVAFGTSSPEIAISVGSAISGNTGIAVGNVVGSNIFNILACLGLSSLVSPDGLAIPRAILVFDFWVMLAVALICLPIFFSGRKIARWEGFLLLSYYVAYTVYLILTAQNHHALPLYSMAMLLFVLPLSLIALLTSVWSVQKNPVK